MAARTLDDAVAAGCCPVGPLAGVAAGVAARVTSGADPAAYVRNLDDGHQALDAVMETLDCPSCVPTIETALGRLDGVRTARVNATQRRLRLEWDPARVTLDGLLATLERLGHRVAPFDATRLGGRTADAEGRALLRALAVAGFAFANVMLLSVAVWAGLAQDMGPGTRAFLHWISALIALPAIAYAGRPFFRSAIGALRTGAMSMDVPIALAVTLAAGMSLFETTRNGPHVYYDAALGLLFFLLIGRYLDRSLRARAFAAAQNLLALRAVTALVVGPDGQAEVRSVDRVRPGDRVAVAVGETVPVDGVVVAGRSEVDAALVTGESMPVAVTVGASVNAGTINLSRPIEVETHAAGEDTLLAEIARMMDRAGQAKARYVRLADRVARLYAPAVHVLALLAFVGWMTVGALDWRDALLVAVAVLIVTCPCALGLAVPAVQVGAVGRLLKHGVYVKSGDALERLARIDTVVFDKTGTLTLGRPRLAGMDGGSDDDLVVAAGMARRSTHPLARALTDAVPGAPAVDGVVEFPGDGLEADVGGETVRLGRLNWVGGRDGGEPPTHAGPEMWLRRAARPAVRLRFADTTRPDAAATVAALQARGLDVRLLSGDRPPVVAALAAALGIEIWRGGCRPDDKIHVLQDLAAVGRRVAMVGDGLNDAPALATAFVSISPASGADISQTAADLVFRGDGLALVAEAHRIARRGDRLVKQNIGLALAYNLIAVPLAMAGLVTPLIAAIAMSASSLVVTANALRVQAGAHGSKVVR
ncbi:MAG: cadmium-translocating P-type ATPase [Alphaproteobacteria bacterium]|nr:cadmium-translocating P-type ATPase [Alphaproteobacteria bacterium]